MKCLQILTMVIVVLGMTSSAIAAEKMKENAVAGHHAYFDSATGHQYIKNMDSTYTQYSKIGKVLRTDVPSDQNNLVSGKWVSPMGEGCFLVYEKTVDGKTLTKVVPVSQAPLAGWKCRKLLYSNQLTQAD